MHDLSKDTFETYQGHKVHLKWRGKTNYIVEWETSMIQMYQVSPKLIYGKYFNQI